jgi:glutathione S-transferase
MTTLYGVPGSPFVRKTRVALAIKKLDYDFELTIPFGDGVTEDYKKISPLGKIPALRIDGINIADSSVICAYLEKRYPNPALYPEKPADYAKALWLEEYTDTVLFKVVTAKIFFPLLIAPRLLGKPCDEQEVRHALIDELPPLCSYLETQIGDSETIIPGLFSITDIAIVSQFVNLYHCEHEINKKHFPKLAHYVEHHMAGEYFAELIEEEKAFASM